MNELNTIKISKWYYLRVMGYFFLRAKLIFLKSENISSMKIDSKPYLLKYMQMYNPKYHLKL